jgi:HK97 family phage major capsid protein
MPSVSLAPKGLTFIQVARAAAITKGNLVAAADYAAEVYGHAAPATRILKAAQGAGSLVPGGDWGEQLQSFRTASAEFFEIVAQRSAVGRLAGIRRVPLNTRLIIPTTGSVAYWVAEGRAKPLSRMVFENSSLPSMKVAATIVTTMELLQNTDPRAEAWFRADLVRALAYAIDAAAFDASNPGDAATPASLLDGIAPVAQTTGSPADDVKALLAHFTGNLEDAFFVMSPYAAAQLNSQDYPNVGARGGDVAGVEVITTGNMPDGVVALVDASGIALAEGDSALAVSTQSAIEMENAPTSDVVTPSATTQISLWQTNSVALRAERVMNWRRLRDNAVKYLEGVSWATPITVT